MSEHIATIIVPCYNEAQRLDVAQFAAFAAAQPQLRLIFVNDGSTDATLDVLHALVERQPDRLRVLDLDRNQGKAEAVREGMAAACAERADDGEWFVAFWDADLATPLDDIPAFCKILQRRVDIDMVFGSRVNLLGRQVKRNLMRHYVGRVFATTAAAVLRLPIYDTQCGAKMFRVTPELREILREPFLSKWIFDVELIARSIVWRKQHGAKPARESIYEVPLMKWTDVKGSKLKSTDFITVGGDLLRIYSRYLMGGGR